MTGVEEKKEAALPGPSCQIWRYLVPSSALKEVLVLGGRPGTDAPDPVREAAHVTTLAPDFGGTDPFPFKDGRFDLVILADYGRDRVGDLGAVLRECRRVLTPGGYFYMTAVNRFRARSAGLTLSGFRKNIERAGFGPARWWACFPDAREPRCLVDLNGSGVMDYFVSSYLNLDFRTGPLVRRVGRLLCGLGVAPYLVQGYAVLGRSPAGPAPKGKA